MAKKKKKKKGHKKIKFFSKEAKAKRKARMKKLGKVFLWMNPITAPIMAQKLIQERIKARRAKKKASQAEVAIVDELQQKVDAEAAKATQKSEEQYQQQQTMIGADPSTYSPVQDATSIDDVAEEVSENYDVDEGESVGADGYLSDDGYSNADGFLGDDAYLSAEGAISPMTQAAIDAAKKKANALTGQDKADALATIADIENSLKAQLTAAKAEVKKADTADIVQLKLAMKKTRMAKLAGGADTTPIEPVGKADAEEAKAVVDTKVAAGMSVSVGGIPKWAYYVVGGIAVAAIGYYVYNSMKKKG